MANDENKFLPIFQIQDIKSVSFLLKLEMALATTIRMKFEPVWPVYILVLPFLLSAIQSKLFRKVIKLFMCTLHVHISLGCYSVSKHNWKGRHPNLTLHYSISRCL